MGLIHAALGAFESTTSTIWKDYFYCESLNNEVLVAKGRKRVRGSIIGSDDNIITDGSVVAVNEGQAMMIVEQGAIIEFAAEPGEYTYDASSEPNVFAGGFLMGIAQAFELFKKRFVAGGNAAKDQRVYFFNIKEITGNKYGTMNPVPFRVVDRNLGLDVDLGLRVNGEYSFRLVNPILFYKNVSGNVSGAYLKDKLVEQMRSELLTALQPALAVLSAQGVRYSEVPAYTTQLCDALNKQLTEKWREGRGIEIVNFGINSATLSKDDEEMIKNLQKSAVLKDPNMAAATLASAQADAMKAAASNSAGAAVGFMGYNNAVNAGSNISSLYAAGQTAAPAADTWTCPKCGNKASGNFCSQCGTAKPVPAAGWTCPKCGTVNTGNFCTNCGTGRQ